MLMSNIFHKEIHEEDNNVKYFKQKNAKVKDTRVPNKLHEQSHSLGLTKKPRIKIWCTATILILTAITYIIIVILK